MNDRVVLAHGFTQTARSWASLEKRLHEASPSLETVAVDLPGHGAAAEIHGDLWCAADHLVAQGGRGTYVGYSMGGRIALHAALAHPHDVERLVLIGASAGIDDDEERAIRAADDERLAMRIEEFGVVAFIDEWLTNPLFAGLDEQTSMRSDRLRNTAVGLATSLRTCGTGTQAPLWSRLGEITCPTLVIAGENDPKFRALGDRLAAGIVESRMTVVEGAGHSVHLENPDATAARLVDFLG